MIAVLAGGGLDALQVAAGAGLGHGDGGDHLAADHLGQIFGLLLRRTIGDEIIGDDIGLQGDAGRRTGIGQFFIDDGIVPEIQTQPAILLRYTGAQHPGIAAGAPEVAAHQPLILEPVEVGQQLLFEHLAHRITEGGFIGAVNAAIVGVEHGFLRQFVVAALFMKLVPCVRHLSCKRGRRGVTLRP